MASLFKTHDARADHARRGRAAAVAPAGRRRRPGRRRRGDRRRTGATGRTCSKGKESRSLANEEQLFEIALDEALALLAQPRQFRGRGPAKPPLREFGNDPVSGRPVVAKEGRFGVYVTDGRDERLAGRGDRVEEMTPGAGATSCWPSAARRSASEARRKRGAKAASRRRRRSAKKPADQEGGGEEGGAGQEVGHRHEVPARPKKPVRPDTPSSPSGPAEPRLA